MQEIKDYGYEVLLQIAEEEKKVRAEEKFERKLKIITYLIVIILCCIVFGISIVVSFIDLFI